MLSRVKCGFLSVCVIFAGVLSIGALPEEASAAEYDMPREISEEISYVPVTEILGEEGSIVVLPDSDSEEEAAADLPVYRSEDGKEIEYTDLLYRSHTDEAELVLLDLQDTQLVSCGIIEENPESEG